MDCDLIKGFHGRVEREDCGAEREDSIAGGRQGGRTAGQEDDRAGGWQSRVGGQHSRRMAEQEDGRAEWEDNIAGEWQSRRTGGQEDGKAGGREGTGSFFCHHRVSPSGEH